MKKKALYLLLVFTVFLPNLEAVATASYIPVSELETQLEQRDKKEIKKEIKRRKNYHKSLVSLYNQTFRERYLDLMQENTTTLSSLTKLLHDEV